MFNKFISNLSYSKLLVFYFLLLLFFSFVIFPSHDIIFYYYPWSTSLQLSYYDGPPFIAYVIRLSTMLFGHNIFALNIWGVIIAAMTCFYIVRLGELLHNIKFGYIAAFFWLVYPFSTTRFIFVTLNYDCLDNVFSIIVLYYFLRYLKFNTYLDLYFTGITSGFLLLSKYTGVVLLLGILMLIVTNKNNRQLLRNKNFYGAIACCLVIFLPVVIWNYQHDWASFKYQLTTHSWSTGGYHAASSGWTGVLFYIFTDILGVLHTLLLLLIYTFYYSRVKASVVVSEKIHQLINSLWIVFAVYLIFWLLMSYSSHIAMNYLLAPDSVFVILVVFYLYRDRHSLLLKCVAILLFAISIVMLVDRAFIKVPEKWDLQQFQQLAPPISDTRFFIK